MIKIEINDIITFEDDTKFILLAETNYNNEKYYYLVGVTDNEKDITDDIKIVKVNKDDLELVTDLEVLNIVKVELAKNLETNDFK